MAGTSSNVKRSRKSARPSKKPTLVRPATPSQQMFLIRGEAKETIRKGTGIKER